VLYELLAGTPPFTGPTVDAVMRQHLDAVPQPILRTDVSPALSNLVLQLLAKDPAARPSSAGEVAALLTASVDNSTQVLPFLAPAPDSEPGQAGAAPYSAAGAPDLAGSGTDDSAEHGAHRRGRAAFPFAKVIVAMAVVLAAVIGVALLRESVSTDSPAQAGGTPTSPATQVSVAPKPTPSKTPTKKPSATPTKTTPLAVTPETLHYLAQLVRQSQQGARSKAPREAARELDQAGNALADGDVKAAAEHFKDARQRLIEAQQNHRWQSTPEISALFAAISTALPSGTGDH
jgi:serine/threonine-protein kinase